MCKLTYKLEVTDMEEFNKTKEFYHCTDVQLFFTLSDIWDHLGFKLKRERCGYAGTKGNLYYCITRIA